MLTMMVRMTVPTIVLGVICFGGAQAVTRHFPAERKVAVARPALLQLADQVHRHRLTLEAALEQAQRAVAEAGATDYVKLETASGDFAWYEKSLSGPVKMLACLGPMTLSIVVFLGLCVLFKVEEMQSAINLATARFRRSKPAEPPSTLSEPDDPA